MTEQTNEQFLETHLINLAKIRRDTQPQLDDIDRQIAELKSKRAGLEAPLVEEEKAIRDYVLRFSNATGDTTLHPDITIQRRKKLEYDKGDALAWCEKHAPDCVRVKTSLDVRKFEKQIDGYGNYETVNTPTIAISTNLGHLLIKHELEERQRREYKKYTQHAGNEAVSFDEWIALSAEHIALTNRIDSLSPDETKRLLVVEELLKV